MCFHRMHQQGAGAVAGAAPEEAPGREGGAGPGEHGSVGGAEPAPDDGVSADENKKQEEKNWGKCLFVMIQ